MAGEQEVMARPGENPALTLLLTCLPCLFVSNIHVNLTPIASRAVACFGRALRLAVELAFLRDHFADGGARPGTKIWPLLCPAAAQVPPLHFNTPLVYSTGHTQTHT